MAGWLRSAPERGPAGKPDRRLDGQTARLVRFHIRDPSLSRGLRSTTAAATRWIASAAPLVSRCGLADHRGPKHPLGGV